MFIVSLKFLIIDFHKCVKIKWSVVRKSLETTRKEVPKRPLVLKQTILVIVPAYHNNPTHMVGHVGFSPCSDCDVNCLAGIVMPIYISIV